MTTPTNAQSGHELGQTGEDVAAAFLEKRGFRVLERRVRTRGGEIDLVCIDTTTRDGGCEGDIVFVEVKTRSTGTFGAPEASLSTGKRHRLHSSGLAFLHEKGIVERHARIDVVAIVFKAGEVRSIQHYRNAVGVHEISDPDGWNAQSNEGLSQSR